jgi:hypothetical protein
VGGTSGTLGSFVDLDVAGGKAYTQSEVAANLNKIDFVYGGAYAGDSIYAPDAEEIVAKVAALADYEGETGYAEIKEIPAAQLPTALGIINSATDYAAIAPFFEMLAALPVVSGVPATDGNAFVLTTGMNNIRVVIISKKNTTVSLEITSIYDPSMDN